VSYRPSVLYFATDLIRFLCSNGKIPEAGITSPNIGRQVAVMKEAYERANLDPNLTSYVETHGTGTAVGDPVEARAVSLAMRGNKSSEHPIMIGSVTISSRYMEGQYLTRLLRSSLILDTVKLLVVFPPSLSPLSLLKIAFFPLLLVFPNLTRTVSFTVLPHHFFG